MIIPLLTQRALTNQRKSFHHGPGGVSGLVLIQANNAARSLESIARTLRDPTGVLSPWLAGRPVDSWHSVSEQLSGNLTSEPLHFGWIARLLVAFHTSLKLL